MMQKVLIVDDEPDIRELLEITLGRMELTSGSASTLAEARKLLVSDDFHLCLTDMRLPDGNGIDLVKEIQVNYPHIPVAVITAHGSTETAINALKSGAFDFVSKPVDIKKLRVMVSSALKLEHELPVKSQADFDPTTKIVGESSQIKTLKEQIIKLARSQAPVFISGESGSGKELVARSIHLNGSRRDKSFVAINCGAIPSELMESEFFGHKKGSFTGATTDKVGLFQAANGGSLFLDEIADLPLQMQVKLLRAIQEKSVRPVGSEQEIAVDVRIISASHKNLSAELNKGNLRQDLYYRINVIELQVPGLRERKDDIALIADHILNKFAAEHGLQALTLSEDAILKLQNYNFPGNVRELENILHHSLALADNNFITASDLPNFHSQAEDKDDGEDETGTTLTQSMDDVEYEEGFSLEDHLEKIEKSAIKKALEETRWNRTAAAKKLGMTFRSFRYRLKKLGLDKTDQ
jgi:two-component system, NtrC family, response regulator PilR